MLAMMDYCEAVESGKVLSPRDTRRRVLGIDIDIRPHNRQALRCHPMSHRIDMIEGSSTAPDTIAKAHDIAKNYERIFVCLDSDHAHDHVLAELEAYAPLVSVGSYCVVFDTVIERMPDGMFHPRPWTHGNSPMTAVQHFLSFVATGERFGADGKKLYFEIDRRIDSKLLVSVAPSGYLRRVATRG
jgi:cephalosporin hydroxylase